MQKRKIFLVLANILFVVLFVVVEVLCTQLQNEMHLDVYLGESHAGARNIAELFYSDDRKEWKKNPCITVVYDDDLVSYSVGEIDFSNNQIRIDLVSKVEEFSIASVELVYGKHKMFTLTGKQFEEYLYKARYLNYTVQGDELVCRAETADPRLIMKWSFSELIDSYNQKIVVVPFIILVAFYFIWGVIEIYLLRKETDEKNRTVIAQSVIATILLCLGVLTCYVLNYFEQHFGQVPFGQLVYHLHTPLEGTDISSYQDVILIGVGIVIGTAIVFQCLRLLLKKIRIQYGICLWTGFLGLLLILFCGIKAYYHFEIGEYYAYSHARTTLYEDNYVDGRDINITFSDGKRNLIYVFLESMEITYADTIYGGAMSDNYIPELTTLALENETFSDDTGLNGAYPVCGTTYTMGALTAQTSGVPINENMVSNDTLNGTWESENNYLPGVWDIGDILHEQGYNQEFLIGSNGNFAGRSSYFRGHGDYDVEDYYAAIDKGRIPSDYKVWWGYEDKKLFEFAKEDLKKLSAEEEPFNLTLLTVDTHFTDGYVCDLCDDEYERQYSNVISCSDHQVAVFIRWVQRQDFYEDTTIVIAGDHLTPDSYYIVNEGAAGFDRRVYFTIINPAEGKEYSGDKRLYSTLDLFPTTLSSMGVEIEGNRLGLGVDLYSDTPTLVEEMGLENLNTELLKNSNFYKKKLLYK